MHLIAQPRLAPPGGARHHHRALRAAGKADQSTGRILILHPAHALAVGHRAGLVDGLHVGLQADDRPHHAMGEADQMAADVTQRPQPRLRDGAAPGPGQVRVGLIILIDPAAELHHTANRAIGHQPARVRVRRVARIVIAQHRGLARGRRDRPHRLGIRQRQRHRLFAPDMLAGQQRRRRHLAVHPVRRGDRHHIHGGIIHQRLPVIRHASKAELAPDLLRLGQGRLAKDGQLDLRHLAQGMPEHRPDVAPGQRMGLAHEAGSDKTNAQSLHDGPSAFMLEYLFHVLA